jgi:hypothetical protein
MIGEKKEQRNEEWYDDKCRETIQKEECCKTMINRYTRMNREEYDEKRKDADKTCRKKTRDP